MHGWFAFFFGFSFRKNSCGGVLVGFRLTEAVGVTGVDDNLFFLKETCKKEARLCGVCDKASGFVVNLLVSRFRFHFVVRVRGKRKRKRGRLFAGSIDSLGLFAARVVAVAFGRGCRLECLSA